MCFQIKNLCNLNSFENFPTELTPKFNQAEGFKVLKLILQRSGLANCAFLSNEEKNLAVGLQNSIITVFDLTKKKNSNSNFFLGHRKSVFSIKVSPCNNFLLSGSLNGEIFLWSLEFKKNFEEFQNNLNPIWDLEFSKTGEFFLSSGKDSTISLWNPGRAFPLRIFNGHRSDVNKISWHPIQNFFATGSDDNTVGLWDLRTARKIGNIKTFNQPVKSLTFSPEGNEISFAGFSRFIDTWDIKADRFSRRIKESFDIKIIKNLTYSKNGKFFGYVGNHSIVKIWTKAIKQEKSLRDKSFKNWDFKKSVEGQTERILDFNFSERCRGIIVGSN
mmetsp:Transcript_40430/g.80988  ORF Transcript_40430/g.80988 Transcript_40430/m.80988 type:complete len:331 (+) Transcript_40430:106-1098(+)